MIDISMSFKFYYLPTFRNYFCSVVNTLVGHLESRTVWGLRLDGDLERLWLKLFIHVNSDLSEISQEQLWLLDTPASW